MADNKVIEIDPERLMTSKEVAEFLQVPVSTIHQWRYRSKGPKGFRVGKHIRFRRSDVEAWIEDQQDELQAI